MKDERFSILDETAYKIDPKSFSKGVIVDLAKRLRIKYQTADEIVDKYLEAIEHYLLSPWEPQDQKGWVSGFRLFERWSIELDSEVTAFNLWTAFEIRGGCLPSPFLMDAKTSALAPIEFMLFLQIETEKRARKQNTQLSRNPWLYQPQLWWFKLMDVLFCEKVNKYVRQGIPQQLLSPHWLTTDELQERWNTDHNHLETFVMNWLRGGNGLPAYYYRKPNYSLDDTPLQIGGKALSSGISQLNMALIDRRPRSFLKVCLFRLKDVQSFEENHKDEMPSYWKLDRPRCRDLVLQWRWENPRLTRPQAFRDLKKTTWGSGHKDETLENYLEGIELEKGRPGRPKGSTNRQKINRKRNSF